MNKKPYLDLWGYVASMAPEKVAEEECFDLTWISTERIPEQSMALIPNQFIRYFKGPDEIKARYDNGLMRFSRIHPYRKEAISEKLEKMQFGRLDNQSLSYTVNRSDDVIVVSKDFHFTGTLTNNQSDLELIVEELKQLGGVVYVDGIWRDDILWEEDRVSGKLCPAPYDIPLVVDLRDEKMIISPQLHLKAQKLLLNRIKARSKNKEQHTKMSEWDELVMELRSAFGKTQSLDSDRAFYKKLLMTNDKSAKIVADMESIGISIKTILEEAYYSKMSELILAQVAFNPKHLKATLTAMNSWKTWERRVIRAIANIRKKWSKSSDLRRSVRRSMAAKLLETLRYFVMDNTWLKLSKGLNTKAWDEYTWLLKTFNAELKWHIANAVNRKPAQ